MTCMWARTTLVVVHKSHVETNIWYGDQTLHYVLAVCSCPIYGAFIYRLDESSNYKVFFGQRLLQSELTLPNYADYINSQINRATTVNLSTRGNSNEEDINYGCCSNDLIPIASAQGHGLRQVGES